MDRIDQKAQAVDKVFQEFRALQTQDKVDGIVTFQTKKKLQKQLDELRNELDRYLADEYERGQSKKSTQFQKWKESHQPFHWFVEFYGIIKSGGFDVIIGNPPYIEYSKVKKDYQIKGYDTESCGNMYGFTIERCGKILLNKGYMGMIVQLPIVCTDRMISLQDNLINNSNHLYFANFDDRPGKLFDGLDHIRATILISQKSTYSQKVFSTNYIRWYSEIRKILFENISYQNIKESLVKGAIPKINNNLALSIINKISESKKINLFLIKNSEYIAYFHNAPQYWIRSMSFAPYFWNEKEGEKISSHLKSIYLKTELDSLTVVAILNSSLFYWWFIILSNCRDLTAREINNFPVGLDKMSQLIKNKLEKLAKELMIDLQTNSVRKECNYKTTGKVIYDEFYPKLSKPIIDEIDRVLAQHYGFTDEELDFIINYDIKYRMGKDLELEKD